MSRPKTDAGKLGRALAAVAKGTEQAKAAADAGIGLATLKRELARQRAPGAPPPAPPPAPPSVSSPSSSPETPSTPVAPLVVRALLEEVEALLATLPDAPEARVLGAALRVVAGELKSGVDPSKIPGIVNALRTATLAVREMRGPLPPSLDAVDDRLRQLDGPARRKIEAYTAACDAALDRRMAELRAWLLGVIPPVFAVELGTRLDGLLAPPEVA